MIQTLWSSNYLMLFTFWQIIISLNSCEVKDPTNIMPKESRSVEVTQTIFTKVKGQMVYVPIYSSIHTWKKNRFVDLTAVLSIRNISPAHQLIVNRVDYYDTNGKLIKKYLSRPIYLNALSTKEFVIYEEDLRGGTGANFIVEWKSEKNVPIPIIESVMVSTKGQQGLSFVSRGKVIEQF